MKCPECQQENPDGVRFCSKCGASFVDSKEVPIPEAATIRASVSQALVGGMIAGRYEIVEELGEGGMGKVYRVIDRQIDEEVALKVLKPEIAADKKTIERFRNELKLARKISHNNVCRMYHLGEDEGLPYITMEYVVGEDLSNIIRRKGTLSIKQAISVARQICAGLEEAHRIGVVHRDLNPHNIMIDKKGRARIMDFGIAHSVETKGSTEVGMIIGTPHYMPPEQVMGDKVDARSDIYSLGIILYEMLTGRKPFKGETPLGIAMKHKLQPPTDPRKLNPKIPEGLSSVVLKCMEKERGKRYQNVKELLDILSGMEQSIAATGEITFAQTDEKKIRKVSRKGLKWAAFLVVVVLIVVGVYQLTRISSPSPEGSYENYILVDLFPDAPEQINNKILEYMILRSLTASTRLNIYSRDDFKKRKESAGEKPKEPVIAVTGDVSPAVTGFEITISIRNREKEEKKKFECKGYSDLMSEKISEIHDFIHKGSGGLITEIEGNRTFSQIATDNLDALDHFLEGEEAWKKLDSNAAYSEYRSAIENDPEFSLAYLKLADVLVFRGDREDARKKLETALEKKSRLIEYDLLRLKALMARIDSKPAEERKYLMDLTEAFPLKKEYHYEFAESYFHCGDADEAIKHYSKALELDPDYSLAHNHIAYAYAWIGNHELAATHFKKYLELDHTANSYDSLAAGYMFAGKYDEAIEALNKGTKLNPNLDYLYRNIAVNLIQKGALKAAYDNVEKQIKITKLENTRVGAHSFLAYIEYLRGNVQEADKKLKAAREFYSDKRFEDRLDESPNLPFWLTGIIAFSRDDHETVKAMVGIMEEKITAKNITATNYFPIYKMYLHLKILEGYLEGDTDQILESISEGRRIKKKMGYWDSIFNLPYFFNEYAAVLIELDRREEALELLNEAVAYNPSYVPSHINLAKIHLHTGDMDKAKKEHQEALKLLSDADEDFVLLREAEELGKSLSISSVSN